MNRDGALLSGCTYPWHWRHRRLRRATRLIPSRGSETVLLVEDEDDVRRLVSRILTGQGYRVMEAANGRDALLLSENHSGLIQLMVTDVIMPEMTGKQLVERLQPLRPEMRVLFMSGYSAAVITDKGILEPSAAYLSKPFTPQVLAEKVRQVLTCVSSH